MNIESYALIIDNLKEQLYLKAQMSIKQFSTWQGCIIRAPMNIESCALIIDHFF
jgi:hypothetical protein